MAPEWPPDIPSWLAAQPLLPPPLPTDDLPPQRVRKRALSEPPVISVSGYESLPKRIRIARKSDEVMEVEAEVLPSQSASVVELNERITFNPPRETLATLHLASPPITTEQLDGVRFKPPPRLMSVADRLRRGLDAGWMPSCLRPLIESDDELGFQMIPDRAWNGHDGPTLEELDAETRHRLLRTFEEVKCIFLAAQMCKERGRDENAWCTDVVLPLLWLAMREYGKGKWLLQNIQSQSIQPNYLSAAPLPPDSLPPKKCRPLLDRKLDYAFSYSHKAPVFKTLYAQLEQNGNRDIGHTNDAFTKTTALFSGIVVKCPDGSKPEAEYQLSIWMAASLRKKAELARRAGISEAGLVFSRSSVTPHASDPDDVLVEPGITIVGHEHTVYLAALKPARAVHVLGPDPRFENCGTDSVAGVYKLLRLYGNLLEFGVGEAEDSVEGFWGSYWGRVLDRLAG